MATQQKAGRGLYIDKKLYTGLDAITDAGIGWYRRRNVAKKSLWALSQQSLDISEELSSLTNIEFEEKINTAKEQCLISRKISGSVLADVLGVIAESAYRSLHKRPYRVQLYAAMLMYQGYGIQMATGEGKTLTASLCAVLRVWHGRRCHVITSNDYLAERDALQLEPLYQQCGLRVGYIVDAMAPDIRRQHYSRQITYATSSNVLADYLRDRMELDMESGSNRERIQVLRQPEKLDARLINKLEDAIIDEADSVLADDATTPLIISARKPDPDLCQATLVAGRLLSRLEEGVHFTLYPKLKTAVLTEEGLAELDLSAQEFPLSWQVRHRYAHAITQGLIASHLFHRDRDYAAIHGEIVLVDSKTGRLMPSRSLSHGLHQALEVKEGLELTAPANVSAKMSFQAFFRLYPNLCGMSGTLQHIEGELWRVYRLISVHIPSRLPLKHQHQGDYLVASKAEKLLCIVEHIKPIIQQGRPILIGTGSITESEEVALALRCAGFTPLVLNALNDSEESQIIQKAGLAGTLTVATNMAGRGTDILLGPGVDIMGGLHVVATERSVSRRVDMQLFGRASRQGQPGSSIAILSLEDNLISHYLASSIKNGLSRYLTYGWVRAGAVQIYRLIQRWSDFRASRQRIRILLEDMRFQKLMSFTKKVH